MSRRPGWLSGLFWTAAAVGSLLGFAVIVAAVWFGWWIL